MMVIIAHMEQFWPRTSAAVTDTPPPARCSWATICPQLRAQARGVPCRGVTNSAGTSDRKVPTSGFCHRSLIEKIKINKPPPSSRSPAFFPPPVYSQETVSKAKKVAGIQLGSANRPGQPPPPPSLARRRRIRAPRCRIAGRIITAGDLHRLKPLPGSRCGKRLAIIYFSNL